PGGRWLIDTPGVRSVGLVATEESVAATFADVEELAQSCRFRDCTHTTEPGCAVVAAVEAGELPERRLESWHTLRREAAPQASRPGGGAPPSPRPRRAGGRGGGWRPGTRCAARRRGRRCAPTRASPRPAPGRRRRSRGPCGR